MCPYHLFRIIMRFFAFFTCDPVLGLYEHYWVIFFCLECLDTSDTSSLLLGCRSKHVSTFCTSCFTSTLTIRYLGCNRFWLFRGLFGSLECSNTLYACSLLLGCRTKHLSALYTRSLTGTVALWKSINIQVIKFFGQCINIAVHICFTLVRRSKIPVLK